MLEIFVEEWVKNELGIFLINRQKWDDNYMLFWEIDKDLSLSMINGRIAEFPVEQDERKFYN